MEGFKNDLEPEFAAILVEDEGLPEVIEECLERLDDVLQADDGHQS